MIGIDTKIKRGSGELAILALLDQEPLHGYEISKRIAQANRRRPPVQPGLALSAALSNGKTRLGEGKMGRSQERAQAPLLPPDAQGQEATGAAARRMGHVLPGASSHRRSRPCRITQVLIRERLGKLGLGPRREEEILRELSEHLADHAEALEARGVARDAAAREALDSVSNWPELRKEILSAETEETIMNYRTKVLWLPALCALTLSNGLLALMQIFGPPHAFLLAEPRHADAPLLRVRCSLAHLAARGGSGCGILVATCGRHRAAPVARRAGSGDCPAGCVRADPAVCHHAG